MNISPGGATDVTTWQNKPSGFLWHHNQAVGFTTVRTFCKLCPDGGAAVCRWRGWWWRWSMAPALLQLISLAQTHSDYRLLSVLRGRSLRSPDPAPWPQTLCVCVCACVIKVDLDVHWQQLKMESSSLRCEYTLIHLTHLHPNIITVCVCYSSCSGSLHSVRNTKR